MDTEKNTSPDFSIASGLDDRTQTHFQITSTSGLDVTMKETHERINQLDESIKQRFKEYDAKQALEKSNLITVFGVFASIVTFLSVEIQILKTISSYWSLLGFSIIMLSSLLMFVLILNYLGQMWIKEEIKSIFQDSVFRFLCFLFIVGLIISGIGYWTTSNEHKFEDRIHQIEIKLNLLSDESNINDTLLKTDEPSIPTIKNLTESTNP